MTDQPDPRPRVAVTPDGLRLEGWRCTSCARPFALESPWCPHCRGRLAPATFGPEGVVWSATVLRVPLPGRTPPTALAYVDLVDGPRVLVHVRGPAHDERLPVGRPVRGVGLTAEGDLMVEAVEQPA